MNIVNYPQKTCKLKGMTLIEIIVSLALLAIVIVPFLTMIVNSTRTNRTSEDILDATYVAQSNMEELYSLSISDDTFKQDLLQLSGNGFIETVIVTDKDYNYTKEKDGFYVKIEIRGSKYEGNLVKVLVKVYNNSAMGKLESQMETILSWDD